MRALVIGLGVSGVSAARFLMRKGYVVRGVDRNASILASDPVQALCSEGGSVGLDVESVTWEGIELVVFSPGIFPDHSLISEAKRRGIECIGEAELALRELLGSRGKMPMVAVTGTNGKTTVALLVEHVLRSSGIEAKAVGNVGHPLSSCVEPFDPNLALVVELSSFQLEDLTTAIFTAGAILNITPDHLDRYRSMQEYAEAKCRLQRCLVGGGSLFVGESVRDGYGNLVPSSFSFGSSKKSDYWVNAEAIFHGEIVEVNLPLSYRNKGSYERENALAAWLLCKPFQILAGEFCAALENFKKPPHRLEFVGSWKGIAFINDSKATNVDAVLRAVEGIEGPIILVAGGVDKGSSYSPWISSFQGKVKEIVAIGEAAEKIYSELHSSFRVELRTSLGAALERAVSQAERGDTVLLSPGCSSYDLFRDYAHRGEEFKSWVHAKLSLIREGKL